MNRKIVNNTKTMLFIFMIIIIGISVLIYPSSSRKKQTGYFENQLIDDWNSQQLNAIVQGMPPLGNRIENPHIRYNSTASTIPSWRIDATNDVFSGTTQNVRISNSSTTNNFRNLQGFSSFRLISDNQSGVFSSKSVGTVPSSGSNAAFYLLAQTAKLVPGKKYYFKAELSSALGSNRVALNIYPGTQTAGNGILATTNETITGDQSQYYELEFVAPQENVTLSIRHIRRNTDATLRIHQVGFYLEDDYILQNDLNDLFQTLELKNLKLDTLTSINEKIASIQNRLTNNPNLYSPEVKKYVEDALVTAINQRDQFVNIYNKIDSAYTDDTKQNLKPEINQEYLNNLLNDINQVTNEAFKNDFIQKYTELNRIYELRKEGQSRKEEYALIAEEKKKQIDLLNYLTDEEKQNYKDRITDELDKFNKSIDESKQMSDYDTIENEFNTNVGNIVSKASDIEKVRAKAESLSQMIRQLENLSNDEKADHLEQIRITRNQAIGNIKNAENANQITEAFQNGITKLEDVFLKANQISAKNELEVLASKETIKIENLKSIDEDKIKTYLKDIKDKLEDAITSISEANTKEEVLNFKETAKPKIILITLNATKENAKFELEEYAKDKTTEPFSTELSKIISDYQTEIDKITDIDDVEDKVNEAKKAIDLQVEKEKSVNDLEKIILEIKTKIDQEGNFSHLTQEEKDDYKASLDALLEERKKDIYSKTTIDDVKTEKELIEKELQEILLNVGKQNAKKNLEKIKNSHENLITDLKLSPERTADYEGLLSDAVTNAETAINRRTNQDTVDYEEENGIKNLNKILLDAQKESYSKKLDEALALHLGELEGLTNLGETKAEFEAALRKVVTDAKEEINNQDTLEDVITIYDKAIRDLLREYRSAEQQNSGEYSNAKTSYQSDLAAKAQAMKDIINSMNYLGDKKAGYTPKIDQIVTDGNAAMDALEGEDKALLRQEYNNAVQKLEEQLLDARIENEKGRSIESITNRYAQAINVLKTVSPLTEKQEAEHKATLDKALSDGISAIGELKSLAEIAAKREEIITEIDKVYPRAHRDKSYNEVMNTYNYVNDQIDNVLTHLSDDRKNALKQETLVIITNLKEDIDAEPTIEAAHQLALSKINELNKILLDGKLENQNEIQIKKDELIAALNKKASDAIAQIEGYDSLTPGEKKRFIEEEIERIKLSGIKQIENAATYEEAIQIHDEKVKQIDEVLLNAKRENAYGEIEEHVLDLLDGGSISQEVARIVVENFYEISQETDYVKIDEIVEKTKKLLTETILSEILETQKYVKEQLESYAKDPNLDAIKDIIEQKMNEVDQHNYNSPSEVNGIIEEGKKLIDEHFKSLVDEVKDKVRKELEEVAYKPISPENKEIIEEQANKVDIDNYDKPDIIEEIINEGKDKINNQNKEELEKAKEDVKKELEEHASKPITEEEKEIIEEHVNKIDDKNYSDKESVDKIIQDGKEALDKQKAIDAVKKVYEEKKNTGFYKGEDLKAIEDIYYKAVEDITKATDNIRAIRQEAINNLNNIKVKEVTTGDFSYGNGNIEYKDGSPKVITSIMNQEGMLAGTQIKIEVGNLTKDKIKELENLIKSNNLDLLSNKKIIAKYNISLMTQDGIIITEFEGRYEVRILLTKDMRNIEKPIVFHQGTELKILNTKLESGWLIFETEHFSEFYLMEESKTNMLDNLLDYIIILLSVTILIEILIILIKKRRKYIRNIQ
ncbi:hypothetical protein (DUF1542) [Alteracholeplasma palmae J233]|uniref:DUF1542 domain-containing protein n=1 Tax=Alteracholeplasma palmae (strain ATCC 49389 / J233) TaxID=1318466 RepID=U4KK84_ALTPJ|nr:DUF1542 domain-containing protein [Alteracholeplasma palmae]CCV64099.1 hypothetical protein (DUF1542) [Alteracholeplasma palmae J233]